MLPNTKDMHHCSQLTFAEADSKRVDITCPGSLSTTSEKSQGLIPHPTFFVILLYPRLLILITSEFAQLVYLPKRVPKKLSVMYFILKNEI